MTVTETGLAPHQQRLAELLGKRPGGPPRHADDDQAAAGQPADPQSRAITDGWLTELRENPSIAIQGLQRTAEDLRGGARTSAMLAKLAMDYSEDHSRAEPEPAYRPCGSPGARVNLLRDGQPVRVTLGTMTGAGQLQRLCDEHREELDSGKLQAVLAPGGDGACDWPVRQRPDDVPAWCDYCGATSGLEEDDTLGTGDVPCSCHGMVTRPCKDTGACGRRREARFPPDLARVPDWIFRAQQSITDENSRQMIMAACAQAASEFYLELVAQPSADELELAGQQDDYALHGIPAGAGGAYDTRGQWHPVNFNWSHWQWRHTIGGHPANRSHLISGQAPLPGTAAARAAVLAARQAAGTPQEAQDGQPARHEIPPTGIPPGVQDALDGRWGSGDIPMSPHAQPGHPGAPQRPARRSRRKLVYRGVLKKR